MTEKEIDKMISDHWQYVSGAILMACPSRNISEIEYHYKSAAKHFWKHAKEDSERGEVEP